MLYRVSCRPSERGRDSHRHRPSTRPHAIPSKSQLSLRAVECCSGWRYRPLAVFRRAISLPPALRPRLVVKPGLGLAQCTFPSNPGACTVYSVYIYIYTVFQKKSPNHIGAESIGHGWAPLFVSGGHGGHKGGHRQSTSSTET